MIVAGTPRVPATASYKRRTGHGNVTRASRERDPGKPRPGQAAARDVRSGTGRARAVVVSGGPRPQSP